VLRFRQDTVTLESRDKSMPASLIGVSAGTAMVLGLKRISQTDAPTTAYLMVGEDCSSDCTFCTQARNSTARSHFLSRVAWPPYPAKVALPAVADSFAQGRIMRCCLQVPVSPGYLEQTLNLAQQLHSLCLIPICASIVLHRLDDVQALLTSGVERVSLALDAACESAYREAKGHDWTRRLDILRRAAERFPGRIGTHLIVGLGETEQDMATMLQEMVDRQVSVGLFAFTPVRGTAWAARPPPSLFSYRRIQAARYLLATGARRVQDLHFSAAGQIVSYGLSQAELRARLADGCAFQTAGCPGCNRPYYNERPGGVMYNYPRRLRPEEVEEAISAVTVELAFAEAIGEGVCSLPSGD